MYKLICFFLFFNNSIFSQNYAAEIINIKNDTINTYVKISGPTWSAVFLKELNYKITVINNKTEIEYFPKDLKSIKIKLDNKVVIFDSYFEKVFLERLYLNKIKLYKYLDTRWLSFNKKIFNF